MAKLPEADIRRVTWSSDVYEPSDDSFALVDTLNEYLGSLLTHPAVQLPQICLEVSGVDLVQTDLVAALMPGLAGKVDLLLFNPPYVPTPDEEVLRPGIARAWAGGHLGRRVTDRLLAQLPELLSPTGHAFIVTVPENKPQEIIAMLELMGFTAAIALTRAADEECLQILHVMRASNNRSSNTS